MAITVLISPEIIQNGIIDQAKSNRFEFLVVKDDDTYYEPYEGTLRWDGQLLSDGSAVSGQKTFTGLSTTYYPPWTGITIPAGTFPANARVSFVMTLTYRVGSGQGVWSYSSPKFYTIRPPKADNLAPTDWAFVDDKQSNRFTWEIRYNKNEILVTPVAQASAVFEWRNGEAGTIRSIKVSGAATECVVPANTFPASSSELQWRVTVTMADGAVSRPTAWIWMNTTDSAPEARIVSPKGAYLIGNEAQRFEWEHVIATGTAQAKAELQYSADNGGSWTALLTVDGAAQSVVVPADTLPGGALLWRVRTYNSDGTAGAWSDTAAIVVYAAPAKPALLPVEGVARPVLRWQSAEQQAFEVRADEWSSGAVFGTAKEYRIPLWLEDGVHLLAVRVQSPLGLWSESSELPVTVANAPPGTVTLTARGIENGARLSWEANGDFERYLVYRDGEAVGETTEAGWEDWLAVGKHRYQVRGVAGEFYALSNEVVEWSRCRWGVLSAVDDIDWIPLRVRRGSQPGHSSEASRAVTLRYFNGRSRPVAEISPFVDRVHTFDYTLRREERELLPRLRALMGQTVVYKNRAGTLAVGAFSSLSEQDDGRAVELSFSITETDWREFDEA